MRTLLWLVASLAFTSLPSLIDGAPLHVLSAPNLLRVGTAENIFVECQDCTGGNIIVNIRLMNHPTKTEVLAITAVTLNSGNNFQAMGRVTVPSEGFSQDLSARQYVYLQAQFPDQLLEKVVMVSFQAGYIFIQTDKTLYTPDSTVLYRIFALTPSMEPVDTHITLEIETPDGIILPHDTFTVVSGMNAGSYRLADIVSFGWWKIVAKFQNNPQQSFSAAFEVKEYVLPSFEVKLRPVSPFFYVDSPDLTVNIEATYLFGEPVDGMAYVVFGVMQNDRKKSISSSLQKVPVINGAGVVTLRRDHITQTFPNIMEVVGSSIFVSVSVLTESGSEMVEAELKNIPIVTSPYTISFKKTPRYFQPGLTFDVVVEVNNPDQTPAEDIDVVVDPGQVPGNTDANGLARLTINTLQTNQALTILARTTANIPENRQASTSMVAHPYTSSSNNYIHIGVDRAEVTVGDNLKVSFIMNRNVQQDITYLIMSRGQLVKHGRYRAKGQVVISVMVRITKEMLPSFRIIAYYHPSNTEVASDSLWMDIKDTCMGSLKLESVGEKGIKNTYKPRQTLRLEVTGDKGAKVGLVAVDKGVYVLNNQHRLTQKKVWDIVEQFDTGCTYGGGKNAMHVFYDAGLLFESSTASGTPYRQQLKCPSLKRRKRATVDVMTSFDSNPHYEDDIIYRTMYPESWLWMDMQLPANCPVEKPNCKTTSYKKTVYLPDSITTWQFTGISLSRTHGICVSEPLQITAKKDFFIDLRLPYSAVRGEQVEVKAILHNYSPDPATVRVDLIEKEHICSSASKRGRYRQEVKVRPQSTRSVPFVIIPMKDGLYPIEVEAAVKDSSLTDGTMKMLQVVPAGVLVRSPLIASLDPTNKGAGGKQVEIFNSGIPKSDLVPNTPTSTLISVTGREDLGGLVEDAISGNSMQNLIFRPFGNGEQNMMRMTLPVIASTYLDKTNQWGAVGFEKRVEATQHIQTGFQTQLAYRKSDGSFAVYPTTPSNTWLTAYTAKVLNMASAFVSIPPNVVCDAVRYMILRAQQPDGRFIEVGSLMSSVAQGGISATEADASMTAFCLIAMQETRFRCANSVNYLPESIRKAVTYLEGRLPHLTSSYAVAMTSYALANENKLNREVLYRFVSPDLSHWPVPMGQTLTLEATAYVLLALVKAKLFDDARPVVRWFSQRQKVNGGYGSTQATIMVYQAVAEYWTNAKESEYDLYVDISVPGRKPVKITFNRNSHYSTRTFKFNGINQDVQVNATGTGQATFKMVSWFYALPKEKDSDCQKFNMSLQLIPEDERTYRLRIEILYKDQARDATLTILEIGFLSGFTFDFNDLYLLSNGRARVISKYEMNTLLSEKGSLILYLDKVSHTRAEEITFRIRQELKVGVMQPAAVSVYEYYDETPCVKFYHPERRAGQLLQLCRGAECTCAEENCSVQKKPENREERMSYICRNSQNFNTDFAYKVRVEQLAQGLSSDVYTMRILTVIKEGLSRCPTTVAVGHRNGNKLEYVKVLPNTCRTKHLSLLLPNGNTDVGPMGKQRAFLSYPLCRQSLGLQTSKTYLIMGAAEDIHRDDQAQTYQYVVGQNTWVEYWPSDTECQTDTYRPTCLGINEMNEEYTFFGCLQK